MLSWHQWLDSDTADWGVVNSTKFGRHWISCLIEDIHEIKKFACLKTILLKRFLSRRPMKDTKNWQNWYGRCVRSFVCINNKHLHLTFWKKLWKKWTSDAWWMKWSFQQPSVLYWRLSDFKPPFSNEILSCVMYDWICTELGKQRSAWCL